MLAAGALQSEGGGPVVAPAALQGEGAEAPFVHGPQEVAPAAASTPAAQGDARAEAGGAGPACTLAQMRRFIKSRPYVPLHELRRRFEIGGIEDEMTLISAGQRSVFVGLPLREAGFLGQLISSGEVSYELLLDPTGPAVVGVFPMRPVARP